MVSQHGFGKRMGAIKKAALGLALGALLAGGGAIVAGDAPAAGEATTGYAKIEYEYLAHNKASPKLLLHDGRGGVSAKANVQDFSLAHGQHYPEAKLTLWSWGASNPGS